MFRRLALGLVIASSCACSEPPVKEREQAEGALAAARAADAATYANAELQAAQAALAKYDEAVAQRDYRQALNAALDARDRAYQAAKLAGDARAAARSRAEKLLADLDTLSRAANARLASASGGRPTGSATERLRAATHAAAPALQEARTLVDQQDYRAAIGVLSPVVEGLRRELPPPLSGRRRGR